MTLESAKGHVRARACLTSKILPEAIKTEENIQTVETLGGAE